MTQQRYFGQAVVDTRRAARRTLREVAQHRGDPLVLVGLSGGADSLALALAVAHEAPRSGVRAGAIVVDHGLQAGSAAVAAAAAAQARTAGLDPVIVERVDAGSGAGGPEARARDARYAAFQRAAEAYGAYAILTAHTRSDQAEQVLLGLARGSGLRSLAGIPAARPLGNGTVMLRPFLGDTFIGAGNAGATLPAAPAISRDTTVAACIDQDAHYWRDPHNDDPGYARVRVRSTVLPLLEAELGPGIETALTRTADLAREDADALDAIAASFVRRVLGAQAAGPVFIAAAELAGEPAAIRHRAIRIIARSYFGAQLDRGHTLAIAALVTHWRGQQTVNVPGIAVTRSAGTLQFAEQQGSPRQQATYRSRD